MYLALAFALVGQASATAPAAEPEKKICKSAETETGSMMLRKVCHTKAEWAAIAKANQANANRYRRERNQGNTSPGSMGGAE